MCNNFYICVSLFQPLEYDLWKNIFFPGVIALLPAYNSFFSFLSNLEVTMSTLHQNVWIIIQQKCILSILPLYNVHTHNHKHMWLCCMTFFGQWNLTDTVTAEASMCFVWFGLSLPCWWSFERMDVWETSCSYFCSSLYQSTAWLSVEQRRVAYMRPSNYSLQAFEFKNKCL